MDNDYEELYRWIDEQAISRPKKRLNRDFADAGMNEQTPDISNILNVLYCSPGSANFKDLLS